MMLRPEALGERVLVPVQGVMLEGNLHEIRFEHALDPATCRVRLYEQTDMGVVEVWWDGPLASLVAVEAEPPDNAVVRTWGDQERGVAWWEADGASLWTRVGNSSEKLLWTQLRLLRHRVYTPEDEMT